MSYLDFDFDFDFLDLEYEQQHTLYSSTQVLKSDSEEQSEYQSITKQSNEMKEELKPLSESEQTIKKQKFREEAKNIPKNYGVLIKNYLIKNHRKIIRQNIQIRRFIKKVNDKRNYTREDLKILFQNQQARELCQNYFSSFEIISDILQSSKISDQSIMLKYVKKFYIASIIPVSLKTLKYESSQQQK